MKQSDMDLIAEEAQAATAGMCPMQRALWVVSRVRKAAPETEWVLACDKTGEWTVGPKDKL